MTYPTAVPSDFAGDSTDFLKVKRSPDGCVRTQYRSVTIADSSTAGSTFGIVPFQKGFRMSYGSRLYVSDLDTATTVTVDVGYLYETSTASDTDAFASAVTTGQTGGLISFDEHAGLSWVAADNGWIVVRIAAGPVTTAGTASGLIDGSYDGLVAAN